MYEEDRDLARRIERGDEAAFDAFFQTYYARVFRFCQRRVKDGDVEEVTMDTLRQAMRRIGTYRGEASLITWIYQVARSQVSAHFKRNRKHRPLVLIDDDPVVQAEVEAMAIDLLDAPDLRHDQDQQRHLVHYMLDSLPGDYGRVLEMKYVEGFSVEEIAGSLSTSPTAIQSMLARARKAFRISFSEIQARLDAGEVVSLTPTGSLP